MNKIVFFACLLFTLPHIMAAASLGGVSPQGSGSLKNTTWYAPVQALEGSVCRFSFSEKQLVVTVSATGEQVEKLAYEQKGKEIIFRKLQGMSPCSSQEPGRYIVHLAPGLLSFSRGQDNCYEREEIVLGLKLSSKK